MGGHKQTKEPKQETPNNAPRWLVGISKFKPIARLKSKICNKC
jgi:hypothetical protein